MVLDLPRDQTPGQARTCAASSIRASAAVGTTLGGGAQPAGTPRPRGYPRELALPPGFVSGIYARNDVERGVWLRPPTRSCAVPLRSELDINFAPAGDAQPDRRELPALLPGRGTAYWGASRLVRPRVEVQNAALLQLSESSIDRGTQWAVFEPNGERLWANVRQTISDFLYNEWRNGALLGTKTEEAYFVRCDRSTMTRTTSTTVGWFA